ncbi:MAG: hypothetical protein DRN31_01765, partial [Thermoplasmata archaeon]
MEHVVRGSASCRLLYAPGDIYLYFFNRCEHAGCICCNGIRYSGARTKAHNARNARISRLSIKVIYELFSCIVIIAYVDIIH